MVGLWMGTFGQTIELRGGPGSESEKPGD